MIKLLFILINVLKIACIELPNNASEKASFQTTMQSFYPDCLINGVLVKHNESTAIELGGYPRCVECTCMHGNTRCTGSWRSRYRTVTLKRQRSIASAAAICRNPKNIRCQKEAYSWTHNGCNYTCSNYTLKFDFIDKPWCQRLARTDYCAECGNKTDFFNKYGSMLTLCKNLEEVIKKEEICDGFADCEDQTDEESCTHYYCQRNETKFNDTFIVWPRTRVNNSVEVPCSVLYRWWNGTITRKCQMQHGMRAHFSELDYCSCTDSRTFSLRLDITSHDNETTISRSIMEMSQSLLAYARSAVRASQYMNMKRILNDIAGNNEDRYQILDVLDCIPPHAPPCIEDKNQIYTRSSDNLSRKRLWGRQPIVSAQIASYREILISETKLLQMTKMESGITAYSQMDKNSIRKPPIIAKNNTKVKMNNSSWTDVAEQTRNRSIHSNLTVAMKEKIQKILKKIKENKEHLKHIKIATMIETFLGSLSMLSCIVCLVMYKILRVVESTKTFLHKNLFMAWVLAYALQLIGNAFDAEFREKKDFCTGYLIVSHYSILAFFTWMLLEGYNLWMVLIVVFNSRNKKHFLFSLMGWGFPLCITAIETGIFFETFKKNKSCVGLETNNWLFKGPMGFILVINSIIFFAVVFVTLKNTRRSAKLSTKPSKSMSTGKAFLVLLPLCGITYLLGFGISNIVIMYIYVIVNSLMGLMLSIFHFLLDSSVQNSFAVYQRKKTNRKRITSEINSTRLHKI